MRLWKISTASLLAVHENVYASPPAEFHCALPEVEAQGNPACAISVMASPPSDTTMLLAVYELPFFSTTLLVLLTLLLLLTYIRQFLLAVFSATGSSLVSPNALMFFALGSESALVALSSNVPLPER